MSIKSFHIHFLFAFLFCTTVQAQDIELYEQINGPYDFVAIGNTMNLMENNYGGPCIILDESSAQLNLPPNDGVVAAYLYWAGSGTADTQVVLNGTPITAERLFSPFLAGFPSLEFYGAFADVTQQVAATGNGTYHLSDFNMNANLQDYCNIGLNFGGWAIIVVYQINGLPLSQINIYDGFEVMGDGVNNVLDIEITNLLLSEVTGAKIGFLAWEGDEAGAVNETVSLNGDLLSDPPLNPVDNVFNSTNSYTGANDLYNMDLDLFIIENYVQVGDTDALLTLTSGQDVVFMNNIVTMMRSELPDATIEITAFDYHSCDPREVAISYTVHNVNSTADLPQGTPITFYAGDVVIQTVSTQATIPIGGSENNTLILQIPADAEHVFDLLVRVDDVGDGTGIVYELNENNNTDMIFDIVFVNVDTFAVQDLSRCENPFAEPYFNLWDALPVFTGQTTVDFYHSQEDATQETNPIGNPGLYLPNAGGETIFVRFGNPPCFIIDSFAIESVPIFQTTTDFISIDYTLSGSLGNQTVTIHNPGEGNYVYAQESMEAGFTEDNVFANLSAGMHTFYVVDLDGCGYISFRVHLIDFMLFFTPNNDGHNDYWNILGWDAESNNLREVYIYNRYGRVVHKLDLNSPGWDGTFKGRPLPSDDYWFKATFTDGTTYRGHFTMKR